jgi:hypothetical protein
MAKLKASLVIIGALLALALLCVANILTDGIVCHLLLIAGFIALIVAGCALAWKKLRKHFEEKQ